MEPLGWEPDVDGDAAQHARTGRGRPSLTGQRAISPQVTFRLTPQLRARADAEAARQGRRLSDVAREALERYLDR